MIARTHVLIRVKSDIPLKRAGDFLPDGSYLAEVRGLARDAARNAAPAGKGRRAWRSPVHRPRSPTPLPAAPRSPPSGAAPPLPPSPPAPSPQAAAPSSLADAG